MVSATSVADTLAKQVDAIEHAASGVNNEAACKQPAQGEWSITEQISHLCGGDAQEFLSTVTRFVTEDKPRLDVVPGISHFESRKSASLADLLSSFRSQYDEIVSFLAGLDDAQLKRTAHVPLLKETPFGEYPTLEQWVTALSEFHLGGHLAQITQTRSAIGA